MDIETKLSALRIKWKTASHSMRQIILLQVRSLKLAQERSIKTEQKKEAKERQLNLTAV
jgi:hypothetical protein